MLKKDMSMMIKKGELLVKPIKVLHYIPGFDLGGIESRLLDWYKNIDRSKIQFDVLILTDLDNELVRKIELLGGNVYKINSFSPKTVITFRRDVKNFFKKNHDYSVIHCHSLTTGYFILKEAKKYGISSRIIHSRTTSFNNDEKHPFVKNLMKNKTPLFATDYFACSIEAGEWAFSNKLLRSRKFEVINNGIEAQKFVFNLEKRKELRKSLKLEDKFVIGNVARFSPPKNHEFILKVFSEVLKQNKNSELIFIGEGPTENKIKQMAKEMDILDNVLFLGRQNNVEDYMQCMDVFLFPSYFEGFGTVAVEAQAAGLPCVVSEGVPKSVDITNLIEHLPLATGPVKWANQILQYKECYERKNMYTEITKAGFNVETTAKWLEKFYLK